MWGMEGMGKGKNLDMALWTLSFRNSLCLPQPHPCLSSSLHTGHHSEHHTTLAAWLWLIGMRTSLCGVVRSKWVLARELWPTWALCGKMTSWSQHVCLFFSHCQCEYKTQRSQHRRIWQKPGRGQIPWG